MNKAHPYSVLLLQPDYIAVNYGEDTYYTHVWASTPQDAAFVAQGEAFNAVNGKEFDRSDPPVCQNPLDYLVLLVTYGHHSDLHLE